MREVENCLKGIKDSKMGASFGLLKQAVLENPNADTILSLVALPSMEHMDADKIGILIAAIQEGILGERVVEVLCELICRAAPNSLANHWESIRSIVCDGTFYKLNRRQQLLLTNTVETVFAKGYSEAKELLPEILHRISLINAEFTPYSDENIRITLARLAYSCNCYNYNERIEAICHLKSDLKKANYSNLKGMVAYYKGIALNNAGKVIGYKDSMYYIMKAKSRGFRLATTYINYRS